MDKKKVLVVDDEMDMRIVITTVLETSGFQPIVTREGRTGIRKAREIQPDAIILDVMMPGEGGVRMFKDLKADETLKMIPVIMLSAVKKESFLHYLKMLQSQVNQPIPMPSAYLEKPFDPEELIQTLQSVLSLKGRH